MTGRKTAWLGMFTALSVVGASIKVPAIIGSVALDAFPALIAAVLLGGFPGAVTAFFGHMISAMLGGMPLGPMHVLIAIEMAALVWIFAVFYQQGRKILSACVFVLGNSFAASLPFLFLMGEAFYLSIVPALFAGSLLNTVLGMVLIPRLQAVFRQRAVKAGQSQ